MKERTKERTNVYQMVTDRIIAELEKGRIPWEKPWTSGNPNGAFNRITKKPYSLLNQLILGKAGEGAELQTVARLRRSRSKRRKSIICYFLEDNRSR